ncbi:unnamed protein product [Brassicogethes aeneus]|uniref:Nose resistant-to-fluoxetine protein N-terminal domain-containing protein n=1 Tax=Brassicogethes aeneus TaxID=1431903 RepID=A0A9P0FG21_BRAAE|nr:unnamed protein product [Brassicogethes aeneus]
MRATKVVLLILISVACTGAVDVKYLSKVQTLVKQYLSEFSVNSTNKCIRYVASLPISSKLILFDSSAKVPNGILNLNLNDLGSYDECLNIRETIHNETLNGKYCLGTFKFQLGELYKQFSSFQSVLEENNRTEDANIALSFYLGYCLLDVCSPEDFHTILPWATFEDKYCYSKAKEHDFDTWDITAIFIFAFFAAIVLLSTIYDLYLYYTETKPSYIILIAFSLWTNGRKIFTPTSSSDQLTCINGIKAISISWIVYGHVNLYLLYFSVDNLKDMVLYSKDKKNMHIMAASLTVDTFLAVGGLLLVYTIIKASDKGLKLNVPMMILHRYLRLTPALAAMLLFQSTLFRYVSSGPNAGAVDDLIKPCRTYWWSVLLYVQNWFNVNDICIGQSWYLSVDMQIFILTPLVLIPLIKWRKLGIMLLIGLTIAGIAIPFGVTYALDLKSSMAADEQLDSFDYMDYYYEQSYARFGPYVIGMIFGYIIYMLKYKNLSDGKLSSSKLMILALWCISLCGLFACTYGNAGVFTGSTTDIISRSFHNGLNRNAWAFAVCLIISLCALGYGGPVNAFLSLPIFQVLAKISYAIYLTHISVIQMRLMNEKIVEHFSSRDIINDFWADFMNTIIISFFFTAVFESPIITIEKIIFGENYILRALYFYLIFFTGSKTQSKNKKTKFCK